MSNLEHEEILELIPAFALDSLDAEDAALVSRHLPGCEACQAELAAYTAVVDILPLAAPESRPSPALKGRLMARIEPAPAAVAREPESGPSWIQQISEAFRTLFSGPRWRPVVLLIVLILAAGNIIQYQQTNAPDPNSWRRIRLAGTAAAPEASGIIYISADGRNGTVIVDGLPQLGPGQQYQLWLILDGQRTSGAVFSVDDEGYRGMQIESPLPLQDYGAFGITIERAGGSPRPPGERVLGYNL